MYSLRVAAKCFGLIRAHVEHAEGGFPFKQWRSGPMYITYILVPCIHVTTDTFTRDVTINLCIGK